MENLCIILRLVQQYKPGRKGRSRLPCGPCPALPGRDEPPTNLKVRAGPGALAARPAGDRGRAIGDDVE